MFQTFAITLKIGLLMEFLLIIEIVAYKILCNSANIENFDISLHLWENNSWNQDISYKQRLIVKFQIFALILKIGLLIEFLLFIKVVTYKLLYNNVYIKNFDISLHLWENKALNNFKTTCK